MSITQLQSQLSSAMPKTTPLVIDLCSGMGGISLAAQQLGMKVIAGVDIEPSATRTFQHNFPEATALMGSVRSSKLIDECRSKIHANRTTRQPIIVVSGPPCQGFSIAGPRNPNDSRNQILLAVARSIVDLKPRCALIENVVQILDENHTLRLKKLVTTLSKGGFHVNEIVLNAEHFGVPQRRKRVFFLITRCAVQESRIRACFKKRERKPIKVIDVLDDLPTPLPRPDYYSDLADKGFITNHFAMQHSENVQRKIAGIPQGGGPMSYRKLDPLRVSNTLISGNRAPPAHYNQPRSITVREALRLQGFPDNFRVYGQFGSQMGQVSNAVPPPLARVALEVLCEVAGVKIK